MILLKKKSITRILLVAQYIIPRRVFLLRWKFETRGNKTVGFFATVRPSTTPASRTSVIIKIQSVNSPLLRYTQLAQHIAAVKPRLSAKRYALARLAQRREFATSSGQIESFSQEASNHREHIAVMRQGVIQRPSRPSP